MDEVKVIKKVVPIKKASPMGGSGSAIATAFTVPTEVMPPKKKIILKNVKGEDMKEEDYFYRTKEKKDFIFSFNDVCGTPVEREDLLEVFNKVFKSEDNILFYKTIDKEVYVIIIPLKYSTTVGRDHESIDGDFQKHAISFVQEGSVNTTTLRGKLERIVPFIKYTDR